MQSEGPLVSVLISTFGRSRLLRRAISCVLMQSFRDFEIVVIDDCSPDDTPAVVASITDPRIRYYRNETNVGAIQGDRAHVRRFVYTLMRGKYFVYLCDDDYWLPTDLLERQVNFLEADPGLAFVFGNQLSYFLTTPESYLGGSPGHTVTLTRDKLAPYFDFDKRQSKSPHFSYIDRLFPKEVMTSEEYLGLFSEQPAACNRIVGATLYSRAHFVKAGAMAKDQGSTWQAGYEFLMGPACEGGVVFLDEPAILTEIREQNASFQLTQVDHYLDAVKSMELAFETPIENANLSRRRFLRRVRAEAIRNLTQCFLGNTITIRCEGSLGMCSEENIAHPVNARQVLPVYVRNGVWPTTNDIVLLIHAHFAPYSQRKPYVGALRSLAHRVRA